MIVSASARGGTAVGESARKDTTVGDERRLEDIDPEYARNRAGLTPQHRAWLDSVVGCVKIGYEIEADEFIDEDTS
jgi:hypothetical protein